MLLDESFLEFKHTSTEYKLVRGKDLNPTNPSNGYILLKMIDNEKGVVISSGDFEEVDLKCLLNYYSINKKRINNFANSLLNIITIINEWIRETGNYFIHNLRDIDIYESNN